jgi:uncharacterized membrane protein
MSRNVQRTVWKPAALAAAGCLLLAPTPAYASTYWYGFKKFWNAFLGDQNGVVVTIIIIGLISLFIITRGKWRKH